MSQRLYRLGRFAVRRRWRVLGAWILVVVALGVIGKAAGGGFHDSFSVPGAEAQKATDLLDRTFSSQAGTSAQVVFHATTGTLHDRDAAAAVTAAMTKIAALPHVVSAPDPLAPGGAVSPDGTIALAPVQYESTRAGVGKADYDKLVAAAGVARDAGVQVEFGGELAQDANRSGVGNEGLGLLAAIAILLFAFGSIVAMGLPIGTAIIGLAAGMTLITFVSAFIDIPSTSETIATMIGIGVGIDYSLFIITRHRAGLHRGLTVEDAAGRAIATSGQAVIIAGTTVVIAICGLAVAGIPMMTYMGLGAAVVVAVMVLASITLLPAFMGFAGRNIDRLAIPGMKPKVESGAKDADGRYHGWARWSHHVIRHPVVYLAGSLVLVCALSAPALDLRLGQTDTSQNPTSSTLRRSYDLLAKGFGPGFNGPLVVAVDLGGRDVSTLTPFERRLAADADVATVVPATVSPSGKTAVVQVIPKSAPQDAATSKLVNRIRGDVAPETLAGTGVHAYVGGQTATFKDLSDRVAQRLFLFIGLVIALSFVLLMLVFRSIFVPLKAALMNVLSIGAAYGVMVAVFQKGWGASLFGVHESLPIVSFVPMFMFAVLFGLSMDYEVFLLSRIRESYLETHDNTEAVVTGITTTARVITSAALIMIAVFLSFVLGDEATVKMVGIGLATAVFIDATLIRMVVVPSTMKLLGDRNWWLPKWLDRLLPDLDIEGESKLPPDELEHPTEPDRELQLV